MANADRSTGVGGRDDPRLFVAVPLPDEARRAVEHLVAPIIASTGTGPHTVRWVRMDSLHLTLRFLGPTAGERVTRIVDAMRAAAAPHRSFRIVIDGAGGFPSGSRPRALWLGLIDGVDELRRLQRDLDAALADAGWPSVDRPFRAHLTLARSDGVPAAGAVAEALGTAAAGFSLGFVADRLVLFESVTGRGPARYLPLAEVPLGS